VNVGRDFPVCDVFLGFIQSLQENVGIVSRLGHDRLLAKSFPTHHLPLPGLKHQPLGRPARSQSLYRLRSPGSVTDTLYDISMR
jgi:hypothetical protein